MIRTRLLIGLFIFPAIFVIVAPSNAMEPDRTSTLVRHSGTLIDHVISKYRARLRVAAILSACEQEALSNKIWISAEAKVIELAAYMRANDDAAGLEEEMLVALHIGLAYYRSGIIDATRATLLAEGPLRKDSICSSASDSAKLLQAP